MAGPLSGCRIPAAFVKDATLPDSAMRESFEHTAMLKNCPPALFINELD
jgi:hypothetical protein